MRIETKRDQLVILPADVYIEVIICPDRDTIVLEFNSKSWMSCSNRQYFNTSELMREAINNLLEK